MCNSESIIWTLLIVSLLSFNNKRVLKIDLTKRKQCTDMLTDPNVWNTREKEQWNRKETEVEPSQIIIF